MKRLLLVDDDVGYGLSGQLDVVESSIMAIVTCLHRKDSAESRQTPRRASEWASVVKATITSLLRLNAEVKHWKQVTTPRGVAQSG